jgi:hypothetical protein
VPSLEQHFSYLEAAVAEARAAPLSLRKARLAIALLDAYVDRLYAAVPGGAEDILAFRTKQAETSPPLALILAIAEARPGAPELRLETSPLAASDYPHLSEAEFMVSLYNAATVPRLLIRTPAGASRDVHAVLRDALRAVHR